MERRNGSFDLTGQKIGHLFVEKFNGRDKFGLITWECLCECGNRIIRTTSNLRNHASKESSCGCLKAHYQSLRARKHGLYDTPRFNMYKHAKFRASKKNLPFNLDPEDIPPIPLNCPVLGFPLEKSYGVGGVTFNSPTLDRIIPKLGYVKGNVQIISQRANVIKNDATYEEIKKVADYMESILNDK